MVNVETLYECIATSCGEGPVWLDKCQQLSFIDFLASKVYKYDPKNTSLVCKTISGMFQL